MKTILTVTAYTVILIGFVIFSTCS